MYEPMKRWMAAIILSFLLPQAVVNLGSSMQAASATEPTAPVIATEPIETDKTMRIPVLMKSGNLKVMDLEDYIRGVVLAEMPAYFEEEALKAQAIAARTYAMRRSTLEDRHPFGAVCADHTCCQAWISDEVYLAQRGGKKDLAKVRKAVADTAGLVLTFWGNLAETTYFSCSGGQTEDALAVWGEAIHYLQSVESPGEENAAGYEKEVYFSREDLASTLGISLKGSPDQWLGDVTRTEGGGVNTMVIGGVRYTGTELRRLLGLNSTFFTVTANSGGITFLTRGNGHRVGMSQYGAEAMAVKGREFDEILAYYYPGTVIDKLSDVE